MSPAGLQNKVTQGLGLLPGSLLAWGRCQRMLPEQGCQSKRQFEFPVPRPSCLHGPLLWKVQLTVNSVGGPGPRLGPPVVSAAARPLRPSWMRQDRPPSCCNSGPVRQRRELQVFRGKLGPWAEPGCRGSGSHSVLVLPWEVGEQGAG